MYYKTSRGKIRSFIVKTGPLSVISFISLHHSDSSLLKFYKMCWERGFVERTIWPDDTWVNTVTDSPLVIVTTSRQDTTSNTNNGRTSNTTSSTEKWSLVMLHGKRGIGPIPLYTFVSTPLPSLEMEIMKINIRMWSFIFSFFFRKIEVNHSRWPTLLGYSKGNLTFESSSGLVKLVGNGNFDVC